MISINLALLRKACFGVDYIYTYGPLGYLYTRIIIGQSKWAMVILDGFIFVNLLNIFYRYLKNSVGRLRPLDVALVLLTAILSQHINCVLALFIILLYHCCALCNKYAQPLNLIAGIICTAILPFIKLNYGLVAIPLFYLALFTAFLKKRPRIGTISCSCRCFEYYIYSISFLLSPGRPKTVSFIRHISYR